MQQGYQQTASGGRPYWPAIGYLKAAAIIAVVVTHGGPRWYDSSLDRLLPTVWVSYHAPVFLLASGFLYWRPQGIGVEAALSAAAELSNDPTSLARIADSHFSRGIPLEARY